MSVLGSLWPVFVGGGIGVVAGVLLALTALGSGASRRGDATVSWTQLGRVAIVIATASVGALVGSWGRWLADGRPFSELYVPPADGTQFLSNEQFTVVMTIGRLAWLLPVIAVLAAALAVWAGRCADSGG